MEVFVGICKFCGKNAGFLKNVHPECESKNTAEKIVENISDNMGLNTPEWDEYKNSAIAKYINEPEKLPISRKELLDKINSIFTKEEIDYMNQEYFFAININELILEENKPYHQLIDSLRWFSKYGDYKICEKLYPIIDEYIKISDPFELFNYWDRRVEIHWKRNELIEARDFCQSIIEISKNVSDFVKNELNSPNLLISNGYKRILMLLAKEKDFEQIIKICEKAKSEGWKGEWDNHIEKAKMKIEKSIKK